MGLRFVSENLQTQTPTDALGNTGALLKDFSDPVRSLTFFNNSSHKQYLRVDTPNSVPVQIPASTSFSLQFADLLTENVHKIEVFGTSGDLVTITIVTGTLAQLKKALITLGLLSS